ncbi:MAG: hypothetical protein ABI859_10050 [Pseudomonadota bacterium]
MFLRYGLMDNGSFSALPEEDRAIVERARPGGGGLRAGLISADAALIAETRCHPPL